MARNKKGLWCRVWRWLGFCCVTASVLKYQAEAWMLPMISNRKTSSSTTWSRSPARHLHGSSPTAIRNEVGQQEDTNHDGHNSEKPSKQQPKRRIFSQDNTVQQQSKKNDGLLQQQQQPQRRRRSSNSKTSGRSSFRTDSDLMSSHLERIRTAGREGSINFIDPCRVFFGNLDLSINSEDLRDFVADHHRLPASFLIVDAEVITDWRTGQSKGYGFVRYSESIYATNALNTCNGKVWNGRRLMVKAAINAKKQKEVKRQRDLYEQRKVRRELAIQNGEQVKPVVRRPASLIPTDSRGEAFLRRMDPGLVDTPPAKNSSSISTTTAAATEGSSAPMMNREHRRKEERSKPKVKPVSKGFGA